VIKSAKTVKFGRSVSFVILASILVLISGCAYQFSNLKVKPPQGIRSIAIEAVYDTSQKVRPHDILWESLQRKFAANGKLRVTSVHEADAFLQAEIIEARSSQSKPIVTSNARDEPEYDPTSPALPSSYRKLTQAAVLADNQKQSFKVIIKVWHLETKKLLFKKTYALGSGAYRLLDNTATKDNQFLRAEEAFQNHFQLMSNRLAGTVVTDLLRGR